jgi:hypothetical protein
MGRCRCNSGPLSYSQPQHLALVGFEHLEAVALQIDGVSGRRNFPEYVAQQTCDGGDGLIGFVAELYSE